MQSHMTLHVLGTASKFCLLQYIHVAMHALSMIHFPSWRFYLSYYHGSTPCLKVPVNAKDIKPSSSPGLPSFFDIFDTKVEPTVEPAGLRHKPMAENPIQVAKRTPPCAFQVLMSEKRALPWLNSPPDGFLERVQRTKSQR